MLTVSEAAEHLTVSADTIRRWAKKGLIRSTRSKHNYQMFDMEELVRVKHKFIDCASENKYKILHSPSSDVTAIELFSGAGGLALGMENAGIQTKLLVEIEKDCVDTLKINRPFWNVICSDIKKVDFSKYRDTVDIVAGGFPCQSFSYAGAGKGFEDTRGTLFFEFARCVKEVNPKIALGENVKGLLKHDDGKTLRTMLLTLNELGYDVSFEVLRSQFFDVPQKRERLIIIAVRRDLGIKKIPFPRERDYTVSVGEAISDCPESAGMKYPEWKKLILDLVPPGGYWRDLPVDIQKEYMMASFHQGGGKTGMARRLAWDEPSLTLTCHPAQKQTERCHPEETRPLNVREYARIQTFPDNWLFSGKMTSQYKQIGNAVPVNLGYYIGRNLISLINGTRDNIYEKDVWVPDLKSSASEQLSLF